MGLQDILEFVETETNKSFDRAIQRQTIIDTPSVDEGLRPSGPIIFNIAQQADEFIQWGTDVRGRDAQLRGFWHTESLLSGAVFAMTVRMAVLDWEIIGADPDKPRPKTTINAMTRILNEADRGNGWQKFVAKLMVDIYTQDNGGFIELIRRTKPRAGRPMPPVIGIAHLDAARCMRTGDPEFPVVYTDRIGREKKLPWWSVLTVEDMPSPVEQSYGIQYCAITRALKSAQIIRDITLYKHEKVSGGFARAIHLVSGITRKNIEDGLTLAKEQSLNMTLARYSQPVIIPTVDPEGNLNHIQIDLATLPDGFDEDVTLRWYVAMLANAFGVDYQEFAPLPSGALGSGQQSEILHLKSGGKGPAMMISTLEHLFNNNGVIPGNVKMRFKVKDSRSDEGAANARYLRGRDRSLRLASGEFDIEGARRQAVEDGDMTEDLFEQMGSRPLPQLKPATQNVNTPQQAQGGIQAGRDRPQIKAVDTAGFVYLSFENDPAVMGVMRMVQDQMPDAQLVEWQTAPTLHMTLAYAPEVETQVLMDIARELHVGHEMAAGFRELGVFENGQERALHIAIYPSDELRGLQQQVYAAFARRGVALSRFSDPALWTPHITLGYLPPGIEPPETDIGNVTKSGCVMVGRSEYQPLAKIHAPMMM